MGMAVKHIFILAGEASGDVLGAEFIMSLRQVEPNTRITFTGGQAMADALQGQSPLITLSKLAFMGFAEVVAHLPQVWANDQKIKQHIQKEKPDVILCVDYPGYNLRLAEWLNRKGLRGKGTRVVQLVCPQFWAWKAGRLPRIAAAYDAVYPLLPFEAPLLQEAGVSAPYFGHPAAHRVQPGQVDKSGPIALLPGSRSQEWARHIPVFAQTAKTLGLTPRWYRPGHVSSLQYQKVLLSHGVWADLDDIVSGVPQMTVVSGAVVASGTATLEVALRGIPMVVAFKTSPVSYQIGKRIIRVPYISLVNLILGRPAVKECIQSECVPSVLAQAWQEACSSGTSLGDALRVAIDKGDPMPSIVAHVLAL